MEQILRDIFWLTSEVLRQLAERGIDEVPDRVRRIQDRWAAVNNQLVAHAEPEPPPHAHSK